MKKQNHSLDKKSWYEFSRDIELSTALNLFPNNKHTKILEIGGGDGYQAQRMMKLGYDVISIDINPKFPQYHPVKKVDGVHLNFPPNTFDVIYSSCVLEHVENMDLVFNEFHKILKDDGIMIHVVPSSSWTILTNFWHYVLIPRHIFLSNTFLKLIGKHKQQITTTNIYDDISNIDSRSKSSKIKYLLLHPHGIYPSLYHELYYYSKFYWKKLFKKQGFETISIINGPYLYSGYGIFRMKFLTLRSFFAKYLSSSFYIFVVKKKK